MRAMPLLAICWTALAFAQEAPPAAAPTLEERARALHAEADRLRAAAEAEFAAANQACWQKFLVSSCMDDARKRKVDALAVARRIEQEARTLDREKRHRDFDEREARRLEELPKREADAAAQAEKNRQAQQEIMERVERKRIEDEQRAQKNPKP